MDNHLKTVRAAIYTRKSSEEGLEQEFNSLDAQREACKAYIQSQKHEGWIQVDKEYSDGGISGGTLNRPAIQELLEDIKNGDVNMIVVYKIDRLTRSLHDFSKLVEIFDRYNASFVSITQQFNTSTSMGRLTLNMLLSFAQFEREVTGEMVRDKKLASAKKGMWTNGTSPYGYQLIDKKLVKEPDQAKNLNHIFEKYLELKSVIKLQGYLKAENILTRTGRNWTTGTLYELLSRKIYLGLLPHKDQTFEGLHEAIISQSLFDQVQELLKSNNKAHRIKSKSRENSILAGLIFDEKGHKFYPAHATKKMATPTDGGSVAKSKDARERLKRYRYYKSKSLIKHRYDQLGEITQISAPVIENLVQEQVLKLLKNPHYIRECSIDELNVLNDKQKTITLDNVNVRELYLKLIDKVILTEHHVHVVHHNVLPFIQALVYDRDIGDITPSEEINNIVVPIKLSKAKDGATAIIGSLENSSDSDAQHILETLKLSFRCHQSLQTGELRSPEQVANSLNRDGKYVRLIMGLRFLSPKILDRILTQQVPSHWTLKLLFETSKIEDWQEQAEFIKF